MKILLLSMPDSFEHMPEVVVRMPNGALSSLAGNVDPHHEIAIADLILVQRRVRETVERLVSEMKPDVLGLSIMTFQRETARKIMTIVRKLHPAVRIVVGGYDPSMAPEEYFANSCVADFIVRGEGEITFRELLRAMENGRRYAIAGLSFRHDGQFFQNTERTVHSVQDGEIRLPNRKSRVLRGYTLLPKELENRVNDSNNLYNAVFEFLVLRQGRASAELFPLRMPVQDQRDWRRSGCFRGLVDQK